MNVDAGCAVIPRAMKNQIRTILLLGVLSAILIGFGALLGRQWVAAFTILAMVINFAAYFWSDKLVLRIHRAQPICSRLWSRAFWCDSPLCHAQDRTLRRCSWPTCQRAPSCRSGGLSRQRFGSRGKQLERAHRTAP